jgi:hypothetical protein
VITYTTCRGCGGLLRVTDDLDYHNGEPPCDPKRTKAERLALEWLAAVRAGDDGVAEGLEAQIVELDSRPPRLLDAALTYAGWGWPVFPLKARAKTPATRHGFKDATTDPDRIREWWERHPDSNIGLPTGHAFDVIDVDVPDGPLSLPELHAADDEIHGHVATSSGGLHYYVTPRDRPNGARIMPGIDYRGMGGYVVAPPSTLGERGRSWSWVYKPSPSIKGQAPARG